VGSRRAQELALNEMTPHLRQALAAHALALAALAERLEREVCETAERTIGHRGHKRSPDRRRLRLFLAGLRAWRANTRHHGGPCHFATRASRGSAMDG